MVVNPDGSVTVSVSPGAAFVPMDYLQQSNLANLERNYRLQQLQQQQQQALQQRQAQQQQQQVPVQQELPPIQDDWTIYREIPFSLTDPRYTRPSLQDILGPGPASTPTTPAISTTPTQTSETSGLLTNPLVQLSGVLGSIGLTALLGRYFQSMYNRAIDTKRIVDRYYADLKQKAQPSNRTVNAQSPSSERVRAGTGANLSEPTPRWASNAAVNLRNVLGEARLQQLAEEARQYYGNQSVPPPLSPAEQKLNRKNFQNSLNDIQAETQAKIDEQNALRKKVYQDFEKFLAESEANRLAETAKQNALKAQIRQDATNFLAELQANRLSKEVEQNATKANVRQSFQKNTRTGNNPSVKPTTAAPSSGILNTTRGLVNPLSLISFGLNMAANSQDLNPNDDTLTNTIKLLSKFAGVSLEPPKPGVPYYDLRTGSVIGEVN